MFSKILTPLILLFALQSVAQVNPIGTINRNAIESRGEAYINIGPYKVKGSPYFFGESFMGTIGYKGGKSFVNRKIFYNLYDQKAGIDVNNMLFEADEAVEEFYIRLPEKYSNRVLLFKNAGLYGNDKIDGFFNVLEDGENAALLKLFKIRLIPDQANTFAKDIKVFEQYEEYYLYSKNTQSLKKLKLQQKAMLKDLPVNEQVKTYITAKQPDLSKESSLIEVIKVYNNKM